MWRLGDPPPWSHSGLPLTAQDVAAQVARRSPVSIPAPWLDGARPSAVLVVLADGPDGAEVLLTRRSMRLTHHGGEVSFPGGRLDDGESYEQAARREAWEEVGLSPASVTLVGMLQPIVTVVSNSWIVPVVGTVGEPQDLIGHAAEVDRVMWVPLTEFTAPGAYHEERWLRGDREWPVFFFELADETVWGATARMMHQLLRAAQGIDGPEPPVW